ncbi:MAG: hypothetical protein RBJ76_07230 [Stenomitos frigidus ULC029]
MGFPLNHEHGTHEIPSFQPSQIVGLEHKTSCLYAEVVQVIESRQSCWVRPLMLVFRSEAAQAHNGEFLATITASYDLRHDSDLLLPLTLFRLALDVEVLPWLADLYTDDRAVEYDQKASGHQLFREFIQQVWQAHPEVFQAPSRQKKT